MHHTVARAVRRPWFLPSTPLREELASATRTHRGVSLGRSAIPLDLPPLNRPIPPRFPQRTEMPRCLRGRCSDLYSASCAGPPDILGRGGRGDWCDWSITRTNAQSCAEIDPPSCVRTFYLILPDANFVLRQCCPRTRKTNARRDAAPLTHSSADRPNLQAHAASTRLHRVVTPAKIRPVNE